MYSHSRILFFTIILEQNYDNNFYRDFPIPKSFSKRTFLRTKTNNIDHDIPEPNNPPLWQCRWILIVSYRCCCIMSNLANLVHHYHHRCRRRNMFVFIMAGAAAARLLLWYFNGKKATLFPNWLFVYPSCRGNIIRIISN